MKSTLLAGAALAMLVGAAPAAFAQDDSDWSATQPGWYGAIDVGGHHTRGLRGTFAGQGWGLNPVTNNPDFDAFVRIGYRLNGHVRLELEGGYRRAGITSFDGFPRITNDYFLCGSGSGGGVCSNPGGNVDSWTGFGNVLFDLLPHSRINPFVGGGVGFVHLKVVSAGTIEGGGPTFVPYAASINDYDTHFAYQGIAGVSFRATDRLNVDLTYHYSRADNITYDDASFGAIDTTGNGILKGQWVDQSLTLGLRYAFNAPPPPPPPPPAFEARDYTIYFPFDQYVITPEAQAVLQDAAKYATDGHATKEVVVGHTDTSGGVAYNLRLSERRAKATADGLVSLGVPQGSLDVSWVGKTDLAVQTPDGVKEPLNRRSTIHIQF